MINFFKKLSLATTYLPILLALAAEEQAVNALKPGDTTPLDPVTFGKYVLEGQGGVPLQVRRSS